MPCLVIKLNPTVEVLLFFFVGHAKKMEVVHCHSLDSSTKAGALPLVTSSDPYGQRVAWLLCGAKDEM